MTTLPIHRLPALLMLLLLSGCEPSEQSSIDFNFERLDQTGVPYTGNGDFARAPWSCVRDLDTGLVWEIKATEPDLRQADHTYTWYAPDNDHEGKHDYRGIPDGGTCTGSDCDIAAYVEAVNAEGLCGFNDWRMPTKYEFETISDPRLPLKRPTIDKAYFPETQVAEYWTAHDYSFMHDAAWAWNFEFSHDRVDWKKAPKFVRLVRGQRILQSP